MAIAESSGRTLEEMGLETKQRSDNEVLYKPY